MTPLTQIKKQYETWVGLRTQAEIAGDQLKKSVSKARQEGVTLQRIADTLGITVGAVAFWEKTKKREDNQ